MAKQPSHVMIVGGGIGGLFAANALIAHGLKVSVYEQAPALGEVGAGVYITPNSVRHLERVGLGPAVEKWGARVGPKSHYFRHDGTPIAPVQVTDSSGWNATFGMHRADFVDFLAAALPRRRRPHRPSRRRLRAGRRHRPRQLRQRRHRRGRRRDRRRRHPLRAAALRRAAVEAGVPRHDLLSRPGAARAPAGLADGPLADVGRARASTSWSFPVRHGAMVNYVGFVPADEEMKESWSAPGDPDALRAEFAGWDPRIGSVLKQVDDASAGRCTTASRCRPGPRAG